MYLHSYFITGEDMTKDEALRLALEALEYTGLKWPQVEEAITAIKAALEAKDEPYAFEASMYSNDRVKIDPVTGTLSIGTPQRTWVGLTNDELTDLFYNKNLGQESAVGQAIALLKERNT